MRKGLLLIVAVVAGLLLASTALATGGHLGRGSSLRSSAVPAGRRAPPFRGSDRPRSHYSGLAAAPAKAATAFQAASQATPRAPPFRGSDRPRSHYSGLAAA